MAGVNVGTAYLEIAPSARGFGKKLEGQVGGEMDVAGKKSGGIFSKGLKAGALVGGAAIVGLGAAFASGLKSAIDYEKITARTANVIKSTGGAANVSSDDIAKLGSKIEGYSSLTNDAVESGANMLLTFTGIRNEAGKGNDIFTQTTSIMADMSTALGQDTKSSALQLGKALNNPIKGVSALQRVGVSFTESQKKQIKTLQESGDKMGAQKIILKELNTEFGGAAKAAGGTFSGSLERLKNQFSDLLRDTVKPLLPYLTSFVKVLADKALPAIQGFFAGMREGSGVGGKFGAAMKSIAGFLKNVVLPALVVVGRWLIDNMIPALGRLGSFVQTTVIPAFRRFAAIFVADVLPVIQRVAKWVGTTLVPALRQIGGIIINTVVPAVQRFVRGFVADALPVIQRVAAFVKNTLVPNVMSLARVIIANVIPIVKELARQFVKNVLPALQSLWHTISTKVIPVVVQVAKVIVPVVAWLGKLVASILGKVIPVMLRFIGPILGVLIKTVGFLLKAIFGLVGKLVGWGVAFAKFGAAMWNAIVTAKNKIGDAITKVRGIFSSVLSWIGGTFKSGWNRIKGIFTAPIDAAKTAITNLLGKNGLQRVFSGAMTAIKSIWSGLKAIVAAPINAVIGIVNSPFISGMNKLLGAIPGIKFRVPTIGSVRLASGGIMPGYTPGRDVHDFFSPTGGHLGLSGGEAVMRPEFTRAVGAGTINAMNAAARRGGVGAVQDLLSGGTANYDLGGIIGGIGGAVKGIAKGAFDFAKMGLDVLTNPGKVVGSLVSKLLGGLGNSLPAQVALGVGKKMADGIASQVQGLVGAGGGGGAAGGPPGGGGPGQAGAGWRWQWNLIHRLFPNVQMTSNYRPGSRKAGDGQQSMHALGRAIDLGGSVPELTKVAKWILANYGSRSADLLYTPLWGNMGIYRGHWYPQHANTIAQHKNHVHWGFDQGGVIPEFDHGGTLAPGINIVRNNLGKPEKLVRPEELSTPIVNITVNGVDSNNAGEVAQAISYEIRRQARGRYAGV